MVEVEVMLALGADDVVASVAGCVVLQGGVLVSGGGGAASHGPHGSSMYVARIAASTYRYRT